ncbi:hypothetical protein MtrunA17_Chr4g0032421 [Medicago truncatula]|uniref:Uncharacterized protein n=1 Tax=Medicago truncatula TaxID=3880 RepID=A0A396I634_MEDTR|nr:hypothetical protein MtrunA17_Chr4g0032421 [Medicago truncatula]
MDTPWWLWKWSNECQERRCSSSNEFINSIKLLIVRLRWLGWSRVVRRRSRPGVDTTNRSGLLLWLSQAGKMEVVDDFGGRVMVVCDGIQLRHDGSEVVIEQIGLESRGEGLGTPRCGDPYGRERQITKIWVDLPPLNQGETLVWVTESMLSLESEGLPSL